MKIYMDDDFIPALNTEFRVKMIVVPEYQLGYGDDENGSLKITLRNITEVTFSGFRSHVRDRAFSLRFTSDRELPQGMYHLNHEILGNLEIFMVAHEPGDDGFQLIATFN